MNLIKDQPAVLSFLIELRLRLIRCLIFLLFLFLILFYFANSLYTFLAQPLLKFLPQGHLIATQIVSPFFVPFKLAFMAAILLAMPFFLYQLWSFIAPAMYGHEKRLIWPFIVISAILFYTGIGFTYYIIFPMLFHFLAGVTPVGVQLSPDINAYFDFTIRLLLMFGGLFEIPIIMVLLASTHIIPRAQFIKWRAYAIVGAFIVGMLLGPPDVLSQIILALPIWFLYETGIVMSGVSKKTNKL